MFQVAYCIVCLFIEIVKFGIAYCGGATGTIVFAAIGFRFKYGFAKPIYGINRLKFIPHKTLEPP
jgi:hypothetical protein